jgi:CDP-4-dehydro-6-deoxyglucose reductase
MAYRVTLKPSGHSYRMSPDETLLQGALDAGLTIPYGCRNGACGACKSKVLEGQVDFGNPQPHVLGAEDMAAGFALTCCARPLSDVTLEVREIVSQRDIPVRTMPCRVQEIKRVADDVIIMHLKLPTNERLQFIAGQYIEFLLADGKRRAFSLASAPHQDDLLELHLRLIPGGSFTAHVFSAMKERDILRFEGPMGSFRLHEESTRPMAIYWGARNLAGLYLPELPRQWAAEHSHITYVPVLSEPDASDAWKGRTGLVHQAVLEDVADFSPYQVYACGAPVMVEAALRDFTARGLPTDQFFADIFSYAAKAQAK